MIINLYVETLLTDKVLPDRVWKLWNVGIIPDEVAAWAWCEGLLSATSRYSDALKETPPRGQGYSELLNPDPVHRPGRADTPILALEKIERAVHRLTWHPAT